MTDSGQQVKGKPLEGNNVYVNLQRSSISLTNSKFELSGLLETDFSRVFSDEI